MLHEASSTDELRKTEFCRVRDKTYVDYAGSALYSERQLEEVFTALKQGVFGNPHSQNSGLLDALEIEQNARQMTLALCQASAGEYDCVFTSGATGALKLVAESFPWSRDSIFAHSRDNHTSVLGMREVAASQGASVKCIDVPTIQGLEEALADDTLHPADHLFAYPLESNFSGARYDETLASQLEERVLSGSKASTSMPPTSEGPPSGSPESRRGTWWVLLDAAKACSTCPPDLSQNKPHFVALTYYKIFGYPTGLGALLIRKDASRLLRRRYFGGGTVLACAAESPFVRRREGPAGFEDGTNSFLGIAALPAGFKLLQRMGGLASIHEHAQRLTKLLVNKLALLQHYNGQPVCQLYGHHVHTTPGCGTASVRNCQQPLGSTGQGPTVALNLRRSDGSFVGYREVERLAELNHIALRGGCLCNPGACSFHLGLTAADIQENFEAGKVCWDDNDIVNGRPTGVIRVSFGMASTEADVDKVASFIQKDFQEHRPMVMPGPLPHREGDMQLKGIWVYPIKSCRGCKKESWPLGPNGLLFDREWALVGEDGKVLTLSKHPRLALLRTDISLETGLLIISAKQMDQPLEIQLPSHMSQTLTSEPEKIAKAQSPVKPVLINLCAESVSSMQMAESPDSSAPDQATQWLSQALEIPCKLVQQQPGTRFSVQRHEVPADNQRPQGAHDKGQQTIGFANEAQLLAVNEASLQDLNSRLSRHAEGRTPTEMTLEQFRPNLIIGGNLTPFCEDRWNRLLIGQLPFDVAGPCARCKVVCLNPESGDKQGVEPLYTLASYRRSKGQINFGVLLQRGESHNQSRHGVLKIGMPIHAHLL